jgi:SEC-C motif
MAFAESAGASLNAVVGLALKQFLEPHSHDGVRRLAVRLPQELYDTLADEADFRGVLPSALAVDAIQEWLKARRPRSQLHVMPAPASVGTAVRKPQATYPKVGANEPCSCGSGKKYKKCHGLLGQASS